MAYTKAYTDKPIWHNDTDPAINETRLNDLCGAVDTIDDRVIEVDNKDLQNLHNVLVNDLQNNQGLKWDSIQQKWVNGVVGGAVDITFSEWIARAQAGTLDNDLFYHITDLQYVFDIIDDSSTTDLTKAWSCKKSADEISAINTKLTTQSGTLTNVNSGISDLSYRLLKFGNVVSLSGRCTFATNGTGTKTMFNLPTGFFSNDVFLEITWFDNSKDLPCAGRISGNQVNLYSTDRNTQTSNTWYFTASFIIP